ncbi:pitrilysin family protein [Kutzneria buriramensis]|uniref:Putative Zn-dependent peptidase n=1 Tax=Kutzneria buriramensis TaxID=1045776 RepID=A0A3E0HB22_9PSEU|nr:insulinase family protein [Kutzneria buriramensis]REH41235.1 putative Zn-dependent peptidase [Kutzneria buriramensis]
MIKETEISGIRTLIAPGNGPLAAGLVFRVGCADEPLSRRGLTHLVEHLALHRHGLIEHDANAATGITTTHFYTSGSEQAVVSYLTSVCDSLRDLPLERMAAEKTILRTEQANRPHDPLLVWRYGAVGFGAAGYPEWGLELITDDDVREWAATRFTRENAVLWIAGDVPAGLELTLPSGAAHPVPAITSTLPSTPAYFAEGSGKIMLSAIVERSARASLFSMVLERALFRALRTEDGNSYAVAAAYVPRDDEFATITALADALPEKQDAVLGGLLDVLTALRLGRVDADELETLRDKAETYLQRPEAVAAMLFTEAVDILYGRPRRALADFSAELAAVTVEDLREVAVQAMDTMLLQVPRGERADWAGFAEAPMWSEQATTGGEFPSLQKKDFKLILGYEGVSMVSPHGVLTVLYAECVLMQCWPDGARRLIGADGVSVSIEPNVYDVPADTIAGIDELVPDERKAWQPARSPDRIPQRPVPPPPAPAAVPRTPVVRRSRMILLAFGALAVLCLLLAAGSLVDMLTNPDIESTRLWWLTLVFIWIGGYFLIRVVVGLRSLRGPRRKP